MPNVYSLEYLFIFLLQAKGYDYSLDLFLLKHIEYNANIL